MLLKFHIFPFQSVSINGTPLTAWFCLCPPAAVNLLSAHAPALKGSCRRTEDIWRRLGATEARRLRRGPGWYHPAAYVFASVPIFCPVCVLPFLCSSDPPHLLLPLLLPPCCAVTSCLVRTSILILSFGGGNGTNPGADIAVTRGHGSIRAASVSFKLCLRFNDLFVFVVSGEWLLLSLRLVPSLSPRISRSLTRSDSERSMPIGYMGGTE